jgi:hypothetical protein
MEIRVLLPEPTLTPPIMLSLAPFLLALAPLAAGPQNKPDLVVLENGKEIECRVLFEDDERVIYKASRKAKEVARDEVAEVQSIERSMRSFLERYSALEPTEVGALSELALWAESQDLPGEARNLWIRIVLLDSENEQAWTKLGGSNGRRGWRIRVRGRYYTLEKLRERAGEWKTAMELPTAHFLVKTSMEPVRALDISIDLERLYQMYYDKIGQPMQLYPFDEVPELHIYGDSEDAPRPPQPTWTAWYERVGNAVLVRGVEANVHEIRKSVIYLMIRNSFRKAQGNRDGALPYWAREGIANAFAFALRPNPGKLEAEPGVPYVQWFADQANDEKPLAIKKILDSGLGSFQTGPREEQYVRQAYTLVFFLVNAEDGKYRKLFVEYLRSAFDGKGAASHFKKIFDMDFDDLDEEWNTYVRRIAGK